MVAEVTGREDLPIRGDLKRKTLGRPTGRSVNSQDEVAQGIDADLVHDPSHTVWRADRDRTGLSPHSGPGLSLLERLTLCDVPAQELRQRLHRSVDLARVNPSPRGGGVDVVTGDRASSIARVVTVRPAASAARATARRSRCSTRKSWYSGESRMACLSPVCDTNIPTSCSRMASHR